jgi:hypothetical protein
MERLFIARIKASHNHSIINWTQCNACCVVKDNVLIGTVMDNVIDIFYSSSWSRLTQNTTSQDQSGLVFLPEK